MKAGRIALLTIPLAIAFSPALAADDAANKATKGAAQSAAKDDRSPEGIVNSTCIECHGTGKRHAPRIGDRDEWIKRASRGLDSLVIGAIRGHHGMPSRGGRPDLTDSEFKGAIFYMFTKTVSAPDNK
jgi:cytochrome c5